MQDEIMNFEAINAHVEQHYSAITEDVKSFSTKNASAKLCGIYIVVRPILEALSKLIILPKKWRMAIISFITVVDIICPQ